MRSATDPRLGELEARDLRRHLDLRVGSRKRLAARLGLSRQGLYNRLHGDLTLSDLHQAFEELCLEPVEFFLGVARRFHPEFLLYELRTAAPKPVSRLRESLARAPERRYSPEELVELVDGLEDLRFRDPKAARLRAVDALRNPDLPADIAAEAFGVYGVLERYRGRTAITGYCFDEALRLHPSPAVRARILQRFSMLALFNASDPELARKALFRARELYAGVGDLSGLGKTFVDEAVVHSNCGHHRRAYQADATGLPLLGEKDVVYRLGGLQGLAVSSVFLGDIHSAYQHLDQAALVADDPDCFWIVWVRGEIALLAVQYEEALEHFVAVWDTFLDLELGPLEQTLIQLRIVKVYFLQDDQEHLQAVLQDMLRLRDELQKAEPALGTILGEFLRSSMRGHLTSELLEGIYREMRGGTQAAPPLLPTSLPMS